jgi:hypothetical protein
MHGISLRETLHRAASQGILAHRTSGFGLRRQPMRQSKPALLFGAVLLLALPPFGAPQAAEIVISVNKATQSMSVLVDGVEAHRFVVSTGTGGGPPAGEFKPQRLERQWHSRKYGMAPMPYSIFFHGNYAVHGTDKIRQLGRRASKGCVRLHPRDAAVLFDLVRKHRGTTAIVVSGTTHVAARAVPAPPQVAEPTAPPEPVKASQAPAQGIDRDAGPVVDAKPEVSKPEITKPDSAATPARDNPPVRETSAQAAASEPR